MTMYVCWLQVFVVLGKPSGSKCVGTLVLCRYHRYGIISEPRYVHSHGGGLSIELEKNKKLAGKWIVKKEGVGFLTCIGGHCFSILWQRWHWRLQFGVISVIQDLYVPVEGGHSN
jgi:hypothetical protein